MKVFAAAVRSESGDDYLFVSLNEDGIAEQILELARYEYGEKDDEWDEQYGDDYLDYDHYLMEQYYITVEDVFDL